MKRIKASEVEAELLARRYNPEHAKQAGDHCMLYGADAEIHVMHSTEFAESVRLLGPVLKPGRCSVDRLSLLAPTIVAEWPDLLEPQP